MKLFSCQSCGNILYFENRMCTQCGRPLAFLPERRVLSALEPAGENMWTPLAAPEASRRFCANVAHDACNWLTPPDSGDTFCLACRHNEMIPDISIPANLEAWRRIEIAKHRLVYSLLRWRLPLHTRQDDEAHGLAFRFLADAPRENAKVMTGHDNGLITLSLAEADDAEREARRKQMNEPYRTLLGHFRHESGHHYWDLLVRDGGMLEECRVLFGDDGQDYGTALQRHHREGPPADWQERFVSAYATMHPWEDFAETWAHYIHMVDTLEMAGAFGLEVKPPVDRAGALEARVNLDPYGAQTINEIVEAWLPFVFAMNSVNRAMGLSDLYPFVLSPAVIDKLGFIHRVVQRRV
jgi:hypothetical protein